MNNDEIELMDTFHLAFRAMARNYVVFEGTIDSVDETKFTADVRVDEETLFRTVPLRVLRSSQASVIEIPKVGTACLCSFRDGQMGRPQMLMVHATDKLLIKCDQVTFNDGNLGGLLKLEKSVERWNKIEDDINNLKQAFTAWIVAPNDGGAALKAATASWFGAPLVKTINNDVENSKIKQ